MLRSGFRNEDATKVGTIPTSDHRRHATYCHVSVRESVSVCSRCTFRGSPGLTPKRLMEYTQLEIPEPNLEETFGQGQECHERGRGWVG